MALGIAAAYRTAPTKDLFVVASTPPLRLLVEERAVGRTRDETIHISQGEWETRTSWTRTFIKDVKPWIKRNHGEINYWVTKLLIGHGEVGVYLFKIKKRETEDCRDCGQRDREGHAVFVSEVGGGSPETGDSNRRVGRGGEPGRDNARKPGEVGEDKQIH
ncbi:uncharacterized protein LOC116181993 [Photinus pyralis]|uniref:uncharacterized protein LOC116163127 n=1 Tax=Photinus pyralis TaxID=7054 RepID=UPI0012677D20|nr:uncharacterized protein LOC116163127 [Photinus pyralis]XP_031358313.1 uncharacterized protein LOC116181993 [Photinus pyralis]